MFKLFKKTKPEIYSDNDNKDVTNADKKALIKPEIKTKLTLSQRLKRTKEALTQNLFKLLTGKNILSDDVIEELEILLLQADVGVQTTDKVIVQLQKYAKKNTLKDKQDLYKGIKKILADLLIQAPALDLAAHQPFVILVIGVNGAGKTTTIGKLAKQFQQQGKTVMLAAGDTFRAAAVEQLKVWGQRNNITVIAQKTGADAAAVIYDALSSASSKGVDVLIADTAGRLHTQKNLMSELAKIKRILQKNNSSAPNETMLVLDGNIGGNAVFQAAEFHAKIGVDSVSVTKLDGSAKGGMLFAICDELKLPVRYIGVGEGIDDLLTFDKDNFINAILD